MLSLRAPAVVLLAGFLAATGACAAFKSDASSAADAGPGGDDAGGTSDDGSSADARGDGQPGSGGEAGGDDGSSTTDGGGDGGADAGDATLGPTGLDPAVVLPNLNEPACNDPGNPSVCGGVAACRMATPDSGRCDDCSMQGTCGGLVKSFCSQSLDCDVDLQCFRGQCTLFCTLPAGTECGTPGICVDVGSVQKGLCDPSQLP